MKIASGPLAAGPLVTGFAGRLLKIDGFARPGGVILTPESAIDWDNNDLDAAIDLDPPPEFVLFGSGATFVTPARDLIQSLEARGIGLEAMDTRAAARAWSLLRAEGRWVTAALKAL